MAVYISSPQLTVPTKVKLKTGAVSSSEASETINQYSVIPHRTLISSYITYISIQIYFCRWQILQNCRIAYTFWSAPFKQSPGPTTKAAASVKLRCDVEVTPILPFGLYLNLQHTSCWNEYCGIPGCDVKTVKPHAYLSPFCHCLQIVQSHCPGFQKSLSYQNYIKL